MLTLCAGALKVFIHALLNPPPPNEALRAAANRYRRLIGTQG